MSRAVEHEEEKHDDPPPTTTIVKVKKKGSVSKSTPVGMDDGVNVSVSTRTTARAGVKKEERVSTVEDGAGSRKDDAPVGEADASTPTLARKHVCTVAKVSGGQGKKGRQNGDATTDLVTEKAQGKDNIMNSGKQAKNGKRKSAKTKAKATVVEEGGAGIQLQMHNAGLVTADKGKIGRAANDEGDNDSDSATGKVEPSTDKKAAVDAAGAGQKSGSAPAVPKAKSSDKDDNSTSRGPSRKKAGKVDKKKKKESAAQGQNQPKISDHFLVRRSTRISGKPSKSLNDRLLDELFSGSVLDSIESYDAGIKGLGVRSTATIQKNVVVCEYNGELLDFDDAVKREKDYKKDPRIGSYMYFFNFKDKKYCVDATLAKGLGRLINHGKKKANLKTKLLDENGTPRLVLMSISKIPPGTELLYDYGDRSQASTAGNEWLLE